MIAEGSFNEKRKDPRALGNVPVKISQGAGDIVTETVNISRSGAYCKVDKYIEPMTKLKVNLLLPSAKGSKGTGKKVACEGVVVRVEPITHENAYSLAIFFNNLSQRDSELISDYVAEQLEQ